MSCISMIPSRDSGNVYNVLLYRMFENIGVRYEQIPFSLRYLLRHRPSDTHHYLHFHWPEIFFLFRPREPHKAFGLKGFLKLTLFWLLAKRRGYRLVWTVHEVDVHDLNTHTWVHALSRRILWRLCDVVFAHSTSVLAEATRRWGNKHFAFLIPIGSYDGAYPDDVTRSEARDRLGIPESAFTFVFLGNIRPYKGVDLLIDAFQKIVQDHPYAHLVIAGESKPEALGHDVRQWSADVPNVHLFPERVADSEIQVHLRAADCFVAPYRYIETSSAIYMALAFQLPVIIKSEGNVTEFATRRIGVFMHDVLETEKAMREMLELPPDELTQMRVNAREASRFYSWDRLEQRYRSAFDVFESSVVDRTV